MYAEHFCSREKFSHVFIVLKYIFYKHEKKVYVNKVGGYKS